MAKPIKPKSKRRTPPKAKPATRLEALQPADRKTLMKALRAFIRTEGASYLEDPNVTSIGIGLKINESAASDEEAYSDQICIQFTVGTKVETDAAIEALDSAPLPKVIEVAGIELPTDVLERNFEPTYNIVASEAISENRRKIRYDTIRPGISVGQPDTTAGTLGLIVYDGKTAQPYVLSNWHVLQAAQGEIGDTMLQPGRVDNNRTSENAAGKLHRGYLGIAGDCAVASIEGRGFDASILDLEVTPDEIVEVELLDHVVKSGRTTGTTYGIVRRTDVIVKIGYGGMDQAVNIGCFEIGPDPEFPAERMEISMGGDSGSAWLIANGKDATNLFAGLHFAGEAGRNPDEHALACYPTSVCKKLGIVLKRPEIETEDILRSGYNPDFLAEHLAAPELPQALRDDAVEVDGSHLIPYVHFSVCQSRSNKLPRFVAWNIDGANLKRISSKGMRFRLDKRVDRDAQTGNELYANNRLDRGHVARRVDLIWGSLDEAQQANYDSYFYTNIAPQHERFNRSSLSGIWGQLENQIFEDVDVADLRVSAMAGPIFASDDPEHRGQQIPRQFWKVLAYKDQSDGLFKLRAFVLTQSDLLTNIETLDLDEFKMFEVSLAQLRDMTELNFESMVDREQVGIEVADAAEPAVVAVRPGSLRRIDPGDRIF